MTSPSAVRIISIRKAVRPRNGVVIYANVQSVSRPTRVIHTVTYVRNKHGRGWHCSCERTSFIDAPQRQNCHHSKRVRREAIKRGMIAA
jgi:hypothetical protein